MTPQPVLVQPSGHVHRVSRRPGVWAWPQREHALADGTFGNRWDDPNGEFRVLYASSTPFGALLETLAPLRPDLDLVAALAEINGDSQHLAAGTLPPNWLERRWIGEASLTGNYVDIGAAETLAWLRPQLASLAAALEIQEVDAAAIRLSTPRAFTQAVARLVYEHSLNDGMRPSGIRYLSRYDDATTNWAVFESSELDSLFIRGVSSEPLRPDNPELTRVYNVLGLRPG